MLLQWLLKGEQLEALSCMVLCVAASQSGPQNQQLQIFLVSIRKEQFGCTTVSSDNALLFSDSKQGMVLPQHLSKNNF